MWTVQKKYIAASLTAVLVFVMSYCLLLSLEEPIHNLMIQQELSLGWGMQWWGASIALTLGICFFRLVLAWRKRISLEWRKTLIARARA